MRPSGGGSGTWLDRRRNRTWAARDPQAHEFDPWRCLSFLVQILKPNDAWAGSVVITSVASPLFIRFLPLHRHYFLI